MKAKDGEIKFRVIDPLDAVTEAYKAGIREVVEWVNENVNWRKDAPYKSTLDPDDWKKQLKEWGIE